MEAKEFKPIWNDFMGFYGNITDGKQSVYFESFQYLPAGVVREIFRQSMKQYTHIPSVTQLEQVRDAVVTKRNYSAPGPGEPQEPAIPGVIRASNAVFAKMIISAHADRVAKGDAYLLEHWPAAFAKFWDSRKRLECESDCDWYWVIGDRAFYDTLQPIHSGIWERLQKCYKGSGADESADQNPDDVPF